MIELTVPVAPERAQSYREAGLWDDRTLADGLEAGARTNPDAVALVDDARTLTVSELATSVAAASARLTDAGVGAGGAAILITGNNADGAVAYHALLRTGAVAILLDRRCGASDLAYALELADQARPVVICDGAVNGALIADLDVTHLELAELGAHGGSELWAATEPDRDAPAAVFFTSGTTSRPKGVIHSINTLTAGTRNFAEFAQGGPDTTLYLVSPLTTSAGIMQMHLAADYHGTLVLDDRFDPVRALDRMREHGPVLIGGAPVILERLITAATERGDTDIGVAQAALGGAMLPMPLLQRATHDFGIQIVRVYGSSEAPNSTGSRPGDDLATRLGDDGALLPGTEVKVGSSEDPRECLLRGPGLFLGYVDPDDNARSFEDGWFRTGDAVELHDGRLTVVGRLKDIVNRNGLKISIGEIDEALTDLTGAAEAAAFGVADADTGERLVVAVRPSSGTEVTLGSVIDHLRAAGIATRKLPEELVVWDEALPRTASGKVVRPRLARESAGRPGERAERLRA